MSAKCIFDPYTRVITITQAPTNGEVFFDFKVDLYSDGKEDWLLDPVLRRLRFPIRPVGGDPLPGSKLLGSTFFLDPAWKIRPYPADHVFRCNGNLYSEDGSDPFVNPIGSYVVRIIQQVSSLVDSTVAQIDQINAAVYRGAVCLNKDNGFPGETFPVGTQQVPSNNVAQAKLIAEAYGLPTVSLQPGNYTFGTGEDLSGYVVRGEHAIRTFVQILAAANVADCQLEDLFIGNSVLDGYTYLKHCALSVLSGFNGFMEGCLVSGSVALSSTTPSYIVDCKSGCVGTASSDLPVFDLSGPGTFNLAFRNWAGPLKFVGSTNPANTICVDVASGATVILDASCTEGAIFIRGIASIVDNSGMTVLNDAQVDVSAVWQHIVEAGLSADEILRLLVSVAAGNATGLEGAAPVFRDLAGLKDRVRATYVGGTRTVTVRDAT